MRGTRRARGGGKGGRMGTRACVSGTEQRQDALILSRHQEVKGDTAVGMHAQQERAIRVGIPTV
jgi:hypothetical protein